jgi:uncharacterized damage-inducible protein DinB
MTYAETILPEFEQEMASTRKVLERVPDEKLDWRPHPKSNTIGWNANHLANLPSWAISILTQPLFDFAPIGGKRFESPNLRSRKEIVDQFDSNVTATRKAISEVKDEEMNKMWSLMAGGKTIFTLPRSVVMRNVVLNHIIHHRAILCVYLRLNDIPVPGLYGPSGDE